MGNLLLAWKIVPAPGSQSASEDVRRAETARSIRLLERWAVGALVLAALCSCCWWPLITQQMSGAASIAETYVFMGVVLKQTTFGSILMFFWVMLGLGVLLLLANRGPINRFFGKEMRGGTLVVVAMLPLMTPLAGHGESVPPGYLLFMSLHVLAASAWIGALPGLVAACYHQRSRATGILERFSWLGISCVSVLALSGLGQSLGLLNSWSGLFTTSYGVLIVLKLVLFALALVLATLNRCYWTPRAQLEGRGLALSIGVEMGIGVLLFAAATLLAAQPPPGLMGSMSH